MLICIFVTHCVCVHVLIHQTNTQWNAKYTQTLTQFMCAPILKIKFNCAIEWMEWEGVEGKKKKLERKMEVMKFHYHNKICAKITSFVDAMLNSWHTSKHVQFDQICPFHPNQFMLCAVSLSLFRSLTILFLWRLIVNKWPLSTTSNE